MKREFKIDAEIFDVAYGELLRAKDRIDAKINSGKRLGVRDRDFLHNQIHSIHRLLKPFSYSERMKKAMNGMDLTLDFRPISGQASYTETSDGGARPRTEIW